MGYPCRHGFAYFRNTANQSFEQCLNHVSQLYTYGSLQKLYHQNFIPIVSDTILHDEKTLPPPIGKRRPGRPKKQRYKSRSELEQTMEMSGNQCSNCKQRGHNKRKCPHPPTIQT
jgi:hypothetical protein